VGLLVAGYDSSGPHLYNTCPSGNFNEYRAYGIGSRSQSARTYLEKHLEEFGDADMDALITHALTALSGCTDADTKLTAENCTLGVVGKGHAFRVVEGADILPFLEVVEEEGAGAGEDAGGAAAGEEAVAGAGGDDGGDVAMG